MTTALPVPANRHQLAPLDQLAAIPEEEIWLANPLAKEMTDKPQTTKSLLVAIERLEHRLCEALAEADACRTALKVLRHG
jgi:hypothetical protein